MSLVLFFCQINSSDSPTRKILRIQGSVREIDLLVDAASVLFFTPQTPKYLYLPYVGRTSLQGTDSTNYT
jgi:hypothetical protein